MTVSEELRQWANRGAPHFGLWSETANAMLDFLLYDRCEALWSLDSNGRSTFALLVACALED